MPKKKKFAGKQTKLAKHALTQVLEQVHGDGALETPTPAGTLAQALHNLRQEQPPLHPPLFADLSQEDFFPATPGSYFLAIIRELEDLREILRNPGVPPQPRRFPTDAGSLPAPDIVAYSFRLISLTLREIRSILA